MSLNSYCYEWGTDQEHKRLSDFTPLCLHTRSPMNLLLISVLVPLIQYPSLCPFTTIYGGRWPFAQTTSSPECLRIPLAHTTVVLRPSSFTLHLLYHPDLIQSITPFRYCAPVNIRDCDYTKWAFNDTETHSGRPNWFDTIPFGSSGRAPGFEMKNWRLQKCDC